MSLNFLRAILPSTIRWSIFLRGSTTMQGSIWSIVVKLPIEIIQIPINSNTLTQDWPNSWEKILYTYLHNTHLVFDSQTYFSKYFYICYIMQTKYISYKYTENYLLENSFHHLSITSSILKINGIFECPEKRNRNRQPVF